MAKLIMGAPAIGMAGTTANSPYVALMRGFNCFLRAKVSPSNPRTDGQDTVRAYLRAASRAWKTLTDVQRSAWNAWAALNFDVPPPQQGSENLHASPNSGGNMRNGLAAYNLANFYRQLNGDALVSNAPTDSRPSGITGIGVPAANAYDSGADELSIFTTHNIANADTPLYSLITSISPVFVSAGRTPRINDCRLVKGVAVASSIDLPHSGLAAVYTSPRFLDTFTNNSKLGVICDIVRKSDGISAGKLFSVAPMVVT